jgi:Flp pilus assembly protein TadG
MRQTLKREEGQALTEFAIVLPLLFVVLFAIIEGGLTLNNYLQLTDAVRVAARAASLSSTQGDGTSAATSALDGEVGSLSPTGVRVQPTGAGWTSGQPVEVQASVRYSINLPLFGTIVSGYLTSRSVQRIE